MIIADFSGKKSLLGENKIQKLKKSAVFEGDLLELGKKRFRLRKPIIQHIFSSG